LVRVRAHAVEVLKYLLFMLMRRRP
jgi:hypothetical protein